MSAFRSELAELAVMDPDRYLAHGRYEGRYLVQAAAQVCIDLANHLIASRGWPPAAEHRDAFARLGTHGVLDADLVARMQDLAGLRNRLVHLYDVVDDGLVHNALTDGLGDLDRFAAAVSGYAEGTWGENRSRSNGPSGRLVRRPGGRGAV